MIRTSAVAMLATFCGAWGAMAGDVLLGVGAADIGGSDDADPAVTFDLRSEPVIDVLDVAQFGVQGGVQLDTETDFWVGAGPYVYVPFTPSWRVIGSAMPGYYERGEGEDLDSDLEFRLQLGVEHQLTQDWSVGAYVEHKSNAYTAERNPGSESAYVRLGLDF